MDETTTDFAAARIFFDEWMKNEHNEELEERYIGIFALIEGNQEIVSSTFSRLADQGDWFGLMAMDRLSGKVKNANKRLVLAGFTDAKFIYVSGLGLPAFSQLQNFMIRTKTGWEGSFYAPLPNADYHYIVDGKIVYQKVKNNN